MEDDILADVDVAYLARASRGRERGVSEVVLAERATVVIRSLPADEAPVTVSVRWDDGDVPSTMRWRAAEGSLWRPLVGPQGTVLRDMGDFRAAAGHALENHGEWHDYPFRAHAPGRPYHNWTQFDATGPEARGLRVRSDDRVAAHERAQQKARDLALIEGELHMRSLPPVWAVGRTFPFAWREPGSVRLVMPDHGGHANWLATFPLDRGEDALAFARLRATHCGQAADVVAEPAVHVDIAEWEFPDTRGADMIRAFAAVERSVYSTEIGLLGRAFLKAYGDLGDLIDRLAETSPVESVVAATRALVEAANPAWQRRESIVWDALDILRAQVQRHDMEFERSMEADAEAFASASI